MLEFLRILIYYPLVNLLTFFTWVTPGHYAAMGIILLTLLVRFILLLPSKRAAQTQRRTQQLQPLIEELKKEYGDDRNGFAQAQMALYKENNINPFGSCITLLIQLPILIALYSAINSGLTASSSDIYPWMVRPDFINTNFFGINLINPDKSYVLPILAALAQYWQVRLTMPKVGTVNPKDPTVQSQRMFQYIIPASTLIFALQFPAGVALYWVVSTIFSVVQQIFVNKEKFEIAGVSEALKEADVEHPEHAPRPKRVMEAINEETKVDTKKGVTVTVRKKGGRS